MYNYMYPYARQVGELASLLVRRLMPGGTADYVDTPAPADLGERGGSSLNNEMKIKPAVWGYGAVLRAMVDPGGIPPQALVHAFESYEGPDGDMPGCLVERLMWRFEGVLGVGEAMRDATTSAKIDGDISDYVWNKYIRPQFERVQALLLFRFDVTETAKEANAREERMVPHTKACCT